MDVKRLLVAGIYLFLFSACALPDLSKVFPSYNNQQIANSRTGNCTAASMQTEAVSKIPNQFIVHWADGHFTVEKAETDEVFVKNFVRPHLAELDLVEYDHTVQVKGAAVHATAATAPANWGQQMISLAAVQTAGILGQGVTVAVVDTAIDYSHPDLQDALIPGWDYVSNTAQAASPQDHATHIAGVIAAKQGSPVTGIAPQSKVMGVSFMDATGSGTLGNAILAMQYAAQHGAKVINNSWGGPGCSANFQSSMKALSDQGVLLMVAAGNDGVDLNQSPSFPASFDFPLQITVAASDSNDFMSSFSNSSWTLVHLAAPGQDIYSTIPGGYGNMSGTSMATPFLTGAAALLYSARPKATAPQIKQALMAGIDNGSFRVLSQGRLNIQKALQRLQSLVP